MKREIAEKWVEALRNGEYTQAAGKLANSERTEHCCLGVLCETAIKEGLKLDVSPSLSSTTYFDAEEDNLPESVLDWAGMESALGSYPDGRALVVLNDEGHPFEQIANVIEQHWEEL